MITMGIGRYGTWRRRRGETRPARVLCGYLGCGRWATRTAWDRLYNIIPACPDPSHGRSMTS
jgi:hypothetical protein